MGENPAVGAANGTLQRRAGQPRLAGGARPGRDRDRVVLARLARDRDRRVGTADIGTEVFLLPAARHARRTARSPTPSGCCSGTTRPSSRRRLPLGAVVHVPPGPPGAREARRLERRADRPCSTSPGTTRPRGPRRPDAAAVLREINGSTADGSGAPRLPAARGRRLDRLRLLDPRRLYADGVNQAARRKPGRSRRGWRPTGAGRGR